MNGRGERCHDYARGMSSAIYERTIRSKSVSGRIPSDGPNLGTKLAGHVETIRSIAASYSHLTRSATASPATRRSAATISSTATLSPGTLIERVDAKADAGASWPTIRLAMTALGELTHIRVCGATGQT